MIASGGCMCGGLIWARSAPAFTCASMYAANDPLGSKETLSASYCNIIFKSLYSETLIARCLSIKLLASSGRLRAIRAWLCWAEQIQAEMLTPWPA